MSLNTRPVAVAVSARQGHWNMLCTDVTRLYSGLKLSPLYINHNIKHNAVNCIGMWRHYMTRGRNCCSYCNVGAATYAKCCPKSQIAVEQNLHYMLFYCIVALNLHYVHSLDSLPTVFMWLVYSKIDWVIYSDRSATDDLQVGFQLISLLINDHETRSPWCRPCILLSAWPGNFKAGIEYIILRVLMYYFTLFTDVSVCQ